MNAPVLTPKNGQTAHAWNRPSLFSAAPIRAGGKSFSQLKISLAVKPPTLTPRQTQVLMFVTEGLSNGQTAAEMQVSIKTVEKHRQCIMNRLGLHEITALTKYAVAQGIGLKEKLRRSLANRFRGR